MPLLTSIVYPNEQYIKDLYSYIRTKGIEATITSGGDELLIAADLREEQYEGYKGLNINNIVVHGVKFGSKN
jgi:hypothetical protein